MNDTLISCREGCLQVAGDLTIYSADRIKGELFQLAPDCGADIELDLSAVTALDTAGIQIMLMLRRMAHANGGAFRLRRPSAAAVEVLELCGLQHLIAEPVRCP